MKKYKLNFSLSTPEARSVPSITSRVIVAPDEKWAMQIGAAMIGEEVYSRQFLISLLSVEKTSEEIGLIAHENSHDYWVNVINKLGLSELDTKLVIQEVVHKRGVVENGKLVISAWRVTRECVGFILLSNTREE